jgi:2-polyprenyl-6-methoxyphenol hydroxylase-like FAD-dependent oxidoreductase
MYDVIVVGARVAGASTALLLARRGFKVLCLDQATFPSDTLSNHQIQLPGVARLKRWGLLDAIVAARTPATRAARLDTGKVVLEGRFPPIDGVDAMYGPRRTVLDKILSDAARASGVEVREGITVDALAGCSGRVEGVRGRTVAGRAIAESASLVIGADGKHSIVAEAAGAAAYYEKPVLSAAYYGYWEGLALTGGELYLRARRAIGVWPTNDGLTVILLSLPIADHAYFRSDIAGNFMATLDTIGNLGERVREARQIGRLRGSGHLPNRFRKPYGVGWALVGDAGFVMDPITGQGMSQAFRDAELLADAVQAGFGEGGDLLKALRGYETKRNRSALPAYRVAVEQAKLEPPKAEFDVLCECVQGRQEETDRLFAVISGSIPIDQYMTPANLLRVLGLRGFAAIARRKIFRNLLL